MSIELYKGVRELFVDEDGETQLLLDGIAYGSLAHASIYQMLNPALEFPATRHRFARTLKKYGVDWQLRFLYGRAAGGTGRNAELANRRGLVLFTIYNQAVINSMLAVYRELLASDKKPLAIFSDPGMRSAAGGSIAGPCYSSFYGFHDEAEVGRKWKVLKAQLDACSATLKIRLQELSVGKSVKASKVVAFLYPFLKQCLRDAQAIRNLIERQKPDYVLMGADANKLERLFAIIASQQGIRSVVVQHGATGDPYGYVPVYADCAAIWGETSRAWFMRHGVAESQLVITGNPQLDAITVQDCKPGRPETKFILATNPIARDFNEKLLNTVAQAASQQHMALKLRPHPSEDLARYRNFSMPGGSHPELCPGSLDELIAPGDIVITCNSTIGIDALIRGAFLVIVNIPGVASPIPYKDYGVAETVALSSAEIDKVISAFMTGGLQRNEGKVRVFLQDYLGPLDGNAATRIARLVAQ